MSERPGRGPIDVESLRQALAPGRFGRPLVHRDSVGSTNRLALELAREGAAEGALVLAEEQVSGRGRGDHDWMSTRGLGLYLSLILRPSRELLETAVFGLLGGVAAARAVQDTCGLDARIKWPNDVLVRERKAGGILAEAVTDPAGGPAIVVVGVGINVHHGEADLPGNTPIPPTSLRLEGGHAPSRGRLAAATVRHAERVYAALCRRGPGPLEAEILELWAERGAWVRLEEGPEAGREGRAAGLDLRAGRLVLTDRSGREDLVPLDRFVRLRRIESGSKNSKPAPADGL